MDPNADESALTLPGSGPLQNCYWCHIHRQTRQRTASGVLDLYSWKYPNQAKTRQSEAINLAIEGIPLNFFAKLGAWKNLDFLRRYLLAKVMDVARISRGYRFFE